MRKIFFIFIMGCSSEKQDSAVEIPTSAEIEEKIAEANYCTTSEDCGFIDSCWCGSVANINELEELQTLIDAC